MHTLRTSLALLALASCAAFAAPRTWTSADGRTIEAEYLGRGADGSSLVLARVDTKARVTIPLTALSAEDQAHAATLGAEPAPTPVAAAAKPEKAKPSPQLVALAGAWPTPQLPSGAVDEYMRTDHADIIEIQRRYSSDLRSITSGDVAMNCRSLRLKIERDLARLASEGRPSGPANVENQKRAGAARLSAHWLSRQILPHVAKIEADAAKGGAQLASAK